MAVKNIEASVLARLKQQAKNEGIAFQTVLQLFCQEEFLRRLSVSQYAENLILKGGMFIYTITEFQSRPTRDIDFLMRKLSNDLDNIERIMTEICAADTGNEFIILDVLSTERITVDKKYPGVKTKFRGHIGNVRVPFSIDVGIDDVIVPEPLQRSVATRLPDFTSPEVYTYSLESTIAEKFDAILQRMGTTSRMKDFYDIYYLSGIFDFDGNILLRALRATLEHRERKLDPNAFEEIAGFVKNDFLNIQWRAYEPAKESGLTFAEVLERLDGFLEPIYECIINKTDFQKKWQSGTMKWS